MSKRIEEAMNYVVENNKATHAYHNTSHMIQVYNNVQSICATLPKDEVSKKDCELISIAALFHDINHSGGKLTDKENVEIAVNAFKKYAKSKDFAEDEVSFVQHIIEATQYPYVDIKEDIFTDIIRDSDILGCVGDGWSTIFMNLAKEFGHTVEKFAPMQIKFYENLKFRTQFAKDLQKQNQKSIIEILECY